MSVNRLTNTWVSKQDMLAIASKKLASLSHTYHGHCAVFSMAVAEDIQGIEEESRKWRKGTGDVPFFMRLDGVLGSFLLSVLSKDFSESISPDTLEAGSDGSPMRVVRIPADGNTEDWLVIFGGLYSVIYSTKGIDNQVSEGA